MSKGGDQRIFGPLRLGTVIAASIALMAAVVVWALASPPREPGGDALAWAGGGWTAAAAWYAAGPVDAQPKWTAMQMQVPVGNADRGRRAMIAYGCGSCHVIPGVAGARGTVGPSLSHLAGRAYIAGVLTNAPGDLQRWLINPPLFSPETAMPDMGVTDSDAADMAAYLLTLRDAT